MAKNCDICKVSLGILDVCKFEEIDSNFKGYIVCNKCCSALEELYVINKKGFRGDAALDKYINTTRAYVLDMMHKTSDKKILDRLKELIAKADQEAEKYKEEKERAREEEINRQKKEAANDAADIARKRNNLKMQGYDKAYEYKVISMIDGMGGRADIKGMEITLNELALEGWRVKSVVGNELGKNALSVMGMGVNSTVDELIFILEREYELL